MEYINKSKKPERFRALAAKTVQTLSDFGKDLLRAREQAKEIPGSLSPQSLRQLRLMKGSRTGLPRRTR